jgi:hypothetical protein
VHLQGTERDRLTVAGSQSDGAYSEQRRGADPEGIARLPVDEEIRSD